jgi:hypothetical protein
MSTKTIKQRIAVVAVSALTAGILSVVSAPVANAAASNLIIRSNSTTGTASVHVGANATDAYGVGLLGTGGATLTATATMLASGTLSLRASYSTSGNVVTKVTGGTIQPGHTGADGVSIDNTAIYDDDSAYAFTVRPNSGVTTMTIQHFHDAAANTGSTAGGTMADQIVVTIAATSAFGIVNAGESSVKIAASANTAGTTATDVDSANSTKENGSVVWGSVVLADVYANAVATGGTLIASVTGGAVVDLDNSAVSTASSTANDYLAVSASTVYFAVAQGTAGVATSFTLTISHSLGGVLATKSGLIKGITAKATLSTPKFGMTSTNSADSFTVTFADAAGNTTYPTSANAAGTLVSTYANATVTEALIRIYPTAAGQVGYGNFRCGSLSASTPIQMQFVLAGGSIVKSNVVTATCSGIPAAFRASLDKATYTPGSIATVTITPLDTKGNPSNDYYVLSEANSTSGSAATASDIAFFVGAPGTVVTAPATSDKPSQGVKTYQFIVGSTEGDFNMVVDLPAIRAANVAAGGTQGKITLPYSIKAATGTVTNAEVLKSIVSLIASINKQIQALQKLILRR